jgi:hypothetical protein
MTYLQCRVRTMLIPRVQGRCGRGAVDLFVKAGLPESNITKWDLQETSAKPGPYAEIIESDIVSVPSSAIMGLLANTRIVCQLHRKSWTSTLASRASLTHNTSTSRIRSPLSSTLRHSPHLREIYPSSAMSAAIQRIQITPFRYIASTLSSPNLL